VKKIDGVREVGTALMLNKIIIDYDESKTSVSEIMKTIDRAGYSNYLVSKDHRVSHRAVR
jgi:copper chaperone CopZ